MTRSKRRRSCSCANSATRCAPAPARPRDARDAHRDSPGGLPSQTRRSEESEHFQQFSTPIALGFVAAEAAAMTPPISCSNRRPAPGCWRFSPNWQSARLSLNEIAETRAGLLGRLFRDARGQPAQRRADPRSARSGDPAERGADEPALLGLAACRRPLCRSRNPSYRLGAGAARRRRTARRHHRPQCRARSPRLARQLCTAAAERPRRLYRDDRRPGLCPPRYDHRDAADRHRPRSGRGSAARFRLRPEWPPMPRELLDWVSRLVPPRPAVTALDPRARPRHVSPALRARHSVPKLRHRNLRSSNARRQCRMSPSCAYETCDWTPGRIGPPDR